MDDSEHTRRLLQALYALEDAISACPSGARRRAAVDLVVSRVRRLARVKRSGLHPAPDGAAPEQVDLEELLAGGGRRDRCGPAGRGDRR